MTEHDRTDVKPETPKELHGRIERWLKDYFGPYVAHVARRPLTDFIESVFREGVIAGLRVQNHIPVEELPTDNGEPVYVLLGQRDDLARVRPAWCNCNPLHGRVCSPRRRPAECDTARAQGAYE